MQLGENLFEKFGKEYKAGEIIFCEYEPGDNFYFILSGQVQITKIVGDREKTLDIMGPGDIFGEMAILEQQPRSATVIALEDVRVLEFNRANFELLLKSNPQMALKLLKIFCKRIYDAKRQLMVLTLDGDEYRVADVILLMAEKQGIPIEERVSAEIKLTPEEIASMCAIPVENTLRVLKNYAKTGKIELFDNKLIVNNISEFYRLVHNKRKMMQRNK